MMLLSINLLMLLRLIRKNTITKTILQPNKQWQTFTFLIEYKRANSVSGGDGGESLSQNSM